MSVEKYHILVGVDSSSLLAGARTVAESLREELEKQGYGDDVDVLETGSLGRPEKAVTLVVYPEGIYYGNVTLEDVPEIVEEHIAKGRVVERLQIEPVPSGETGPIPEDRRGKDIGSRIVLENVGAIAPESIDEYIARDGYEALGTTLEEMEPDQLIEVVKDSGLRGRGGAGFPTGLKWSFTKRASGTPKYMVCNADEGEPGTFKDRLILEGDPHKVIEGMAICGYATGASKGLIYIRGEYELSIERIEQAIKDAREYGLLGENLFGSGFDFDMDVVKGAGAYVVGEETALLNSIEGKRGYPRVKPPFPANKGLFGQPTTVNNVETLANVPPIIRNGATWFQTFGTEESPGTKVYTILGHVKEPGLVEVPMGITLREIITEYAGGMKGRPFKMAQLGGTAGGILDPSLLDTPMDFDTMEEHGVTLGSGALLVMDQSTSVRKMLKSFMRFFQHESCGQCIPCRDGTSKLYQMASELAEGKGKKGYLEDMVSIAESMKATALCPLGQSPIQPLRGLVDNFRDELEKGIQEEVAVE
ncbi:MAG: NADH-quinone oxidoreductase subunit NuoF [Candidatus Acetothermia bacterium]